MASETASRDYFDRLAATGIWQDFGPEEEQRLAAHLRRWDIRPGQAVLEPGCGAGRLTVRLAELVGPDGRVLACDPSAAMVARAAARGLPGHVALRVSALAELALPEASFDRVICFHVWPHLPDKPGALRVLHAALRPGGTLWISHLRSREAINRIHREGPPEIREHLLPSLAETATHLETAGLTLIEACDGDDGFRVGARRPLPQHPAL